MYDESIREHGHSELIIETYTVGGLKTCFSWAGSDEHEAEVCDFYGIMKMGTVGVCMVTGDTLNYHEGTTLYKPCDNCPVWGRNND